MYPKGYYVSMMNDIKDMVRHHSYKQDDILNMTPFDYIITKMMIANDIERELEDSK